MSNIFKVPNGNEIPLSEIYDSLKTETYAAIRGIIDPEELASCVTSIKQKFSQDNDNPSTGESPSDIMTNFQKLASGGESKRYNNFPRFFRTLYNPIWADDIYGMRSIFRKVSRVRNLIYGLPEDFAIEEVASNGYWTASRIHQYPSGGGFFTGHRDTTLLDVAKEKGTGFFQVILVMSKKGQDFEQGGAFVDKNEDERLYLEDLLSPGDIAIYNGETVHGVEDIDPHRKLTLDTINGRLAGFVSLYKKMD
ncbi:MAG: hypothetical protein P8O23_10220 [Opitutales bacterium]|nr:hypothetical protein [Opitutales bacterium]